MLRISLAVALTSIASSAMAHPGHIDAVSGHSHYVALGAVAVAAAIALIALRKRKSSSNV